MSESNQTIKKIIADGVTLVDFTQVTAGPNDVTVGRFFYGPNGTLI
jgi:hypothetical protein